MASFSAMRVINLTSSLKLAVPLALTGLACMFASGYQQDGSPLDLSQEQIIHYARPDDLTDPIALLQKGISSGKVKLKFDSERGYLPAILKELGIPVSSQLLVFSKTSVQNHIISPANPRAIYFNDQVYVAMVPGSDHLEFASWDPKKGAIFYALDQMAVKKPTFERASTCMRCHIGPKTIQVPGFLVRSVLAASDGRPVSQITEFVSGHNSPLRERWGGWYVTGTSQNDVHIGNSTLADAKHPEAFDPAKGSNVLSLKDRFNTAKYLSPHSDIVSILVLDDAVRMQDMITAASYEGRFVQNDVDKLGNASPRALEWPKKRLSVMGEALLDYMLYRHEAPLKGEVKGTSTFAEDFQKIGPRDSKGRSLREFDLKKRLFKYPCSYEIYSPAFDAIPDNMKSYLWQRLSEILTGQDQSPIYRGMAPEDRLAIFQILLDTKSEFKSWCLQHSVKLPA